MSHEKKKSVGCRSKEQRRAFSELSFELALALFCKIPFPDSTSFELQVLIAECVALESHKTKQKSELSFELAQCNNHDDSMDKECRIERPF